MDIIVVHTFSFSLNHNPKGTKYFILNAEGKLVKFGKVKAGENRINVGDFKEGLYFLRLDNGIVRKLVKL